MKNLFLKLSFILVLAGATACNSTKSESNLAEGQTPADISEMDKGFLAIASSAGIMEVELGKLASARATRPEIVNYGNMMVKEHTQVNADFLELLEQLQVKVPAGMNERNDQMVKDHAALSGTAFDAKYMQTMIEDHQLATEKFKEALAVAKNEDYKKFLAAMIPIVEMHYHMAQELKRKMNGGS